MTKKKIEVVHINTGSPVPDVGNVKWPFDSLGVGNNFTFGYRKVTSVRTIVSRLNKEGTRQYIVRKIDEDTYGVWRVEDRKE